jgi:hypothetical protein
MSSATGYCGPSNRVYKDLIICKWELDGVDYSDSGTAGNNSCKKIGYSELFSYSNLGQFKDDQQTMKTYIVSLVCTFNERQCIIFKKLEK